MLKKGQVEPSRRSNRPEFIHISAEIIEQATEFAEIIKQMNMYDTESRIETRRSSLNSASMFQNKLFKRSPNKHQKFQNKWLHTSLYFNELK